ncbi:murein L,D-transpeptidase family protein [Acidovorax sp. HDW3]|uniref:L,D-transpeptidase family protein n=1 Tax=Acidovorax sp. HDW3 TaxID=2714923 RepID=UPI001F0F8B25|nr:L,D-transpeptidase [Acidovorax sp. HDW3]
MPIWARGSAAKAPAAPAKVHRPALADDGQGEARLIAIYQHIGQGQMRQALQLAERLARSHPHFQLAQLLYADLLLAQLPPERAAADRPEASARAELQQEARLRLQALRERPPAGSVPAQFMQIAPSSGHAIAVDASRARLYLFENSASGMKLVADYYVSVGKLGVEKGLEGDQRTPLGVYYIGSNLDPKSLRDFYGAGALTLNYPNPYDLRRGKGGSGIWLHGTPPEQYARAPQATDGCVAMANPDLRQLLRQAQPRTTPVVIARQLQWVQPASLEGERQRFAQTLQAWSQAKNDGNLPRLLGFYASDFANEQYKLADWRGVLTRELQQLQSRALQLKELSYLRWNDGEDTMVVTFGEVAQGARSGPIKRQYWLRQAGQWKIFFEGVIG